VRSAVIFAVALLVALAVGTTTALAAPGPIGGLSSSSPAAGSYTFTWNPVVGIAGYAYSLDRSPGALAGSTVALPAPSFFNSQTVAVGSGPRQAAVGDFGNGQLDMAEINLNSNTVTILLNNGHGVFTKGNTYATGTTPHSIAAADFNGDGRLDLAVANWPDDTVSVLLATGVGTFAPKVDYPTALNPHGIAVGDLGNGTPDIVVPNAASNTVSVLIGKGDGTFAPKVDYPAGTHPEKVAIGDYNRDGKPDLAVINNTSATLMIWPGNGDGTFTTGSPTYATGSQPHWIVAGDLGNGQLDLAVANWNSATVSVYVGKGNGTFATKVDYAVGVNPASVEMTDVNGDGIRDLVVSDYAGSVAVLLGRGDTTFLPAQFITTTYQPYFLSAADFNGDGWPDLALPFTNNSKVGILLNTTASLAPSVTLSPTAGGVWYFHVAAVDVAGNPGPTSTTSVSVTATPTISSFTPSSAAVGAAVTLAGTGFTGASKVAFNGVSASFNVDSDTQITATVPAGATSGTIVVTAPGGTATSSTSFTVIAGPGISSFSPTAAAVGATVTLTGSGLTGATAVAFNGVSAIFTVNSDTQITATVPAGATSGTISVTAPGGTATSAASFTVVPAPAISSFTPTSAGAGAGVTVNGTGLTTTTAVSFNGTAATFTVTSDTQISTTVPAGATDGPISVTTAGGVATSTATFTVIPAPAISSFAPASGTPGSTVALTGSHFTGATAVAFNGTAAAGFNVDSDTQITATVPAGAISGPISVTTPGGAATSATSFTVLRVPSLNSFSPTTAGVGAAVTLTGSAFTGASVVAFNGTAAVFTVNSDTQITATVPSGATSGTIAVTTPGGTATSTASFTVAPTPVIVSFNPTSGVVGATVTLSGTGFAGATKVTFNGVSATFTVNSDLQITATVPAGATSGSIAVTTVGGVATSAASFTVIRAPVIGSFSPTSAAVGATVTLTGSGFTGASVVAFNGVSAVFTVNSDTQITATVPAGATSGTISVTAPGGVATSTTSFTVSGTVTPTLTLTLSGLTSGAITLGKSVTFKGTVTPTSLAGSKVTLTVQRQSGTTWLAAVTHTTTITASGTYSNSYKPSVKGTYRVEASIAATSSHTAVTTPWQSFIVK
jgi:hypothetical protein